MYVCMYVCIYIHIYIYIYTHSHIHIHVQQPGQAGERQAHDVEVVAPDALDEQTALGLDAVAAGLVEGLARRDVGVYIL